jgi:tetratricopeptide (TPR) repeat protein
MNTPGRSKTLMAGSLAVWLILGSLGCGRPEEKSSSVPATPKSAEGSFPGGLTPLPNAAQDEAQLAQIQKADELAGAGDWAGAADLLRKAGAAESGDDELLFNLAFYESRAGQTDAALTHYRGALKINPKHVEANNNLGNLFLRRNDLTNAATCFAEAIRLNPKHPSAHNNLGIVLARQHRAPEAIPEFEAAVRLKPDYLEAWINLGNAATTHGRFQQAVSAYEMALKIRPGMPQAVEALKRARARIEPTGG